VCSDGLPLAPVVCGQISVAGGVCGSHMCLKGGPEAIQVVTWCPRGRITAKPVEAAPCLLIEEEWTLVGVPCAGRDGCFVRTVIANDTAMTLDFVEIYRGRTGSNNGLYC
jgi:hypothetical protein